MFIYQQMTLKLPLGITCDISASTSTRTYFSLFFDKQREYIKSLKKLYTHVYKSYAKDNKRHSLKEGKQKGEKKNLPSPSYRSHHIYKID